MDAVPAVNLGPSPYWGVSCMVPSGPFVDDRQMSDLDGTYDNTASTSEVEWLRRQIGLFEHRLDDITTAGTYPHMDERATMPPPPRPAPSAPPPPAVGEHSIPAGATDRPVDVAPPPPWMQAVRADSTRQRPEISLPAIEPLLKWSGLVLMFLSALFLVSTAIQRGWIGPELQLLGAAAIGASLIGGGLVIGQRRAGWDVPLVCVGLAILSGTATAGWQWLELWSHEPWVVATFIVLGLSIVLTDRLSSPGVGATGLTATLLSIGLLATSVAEAAVLLAFVIVLVEAASLWQKLASLHLMVVAVGVTAFGAVVFAAFVDSGPTSAAVLTSGAIVTSAFWLMPIASSLRGTLPSRAGIEWRPTIDRLTMSLPGLFTSAWAWTAGLSDVKTGRRFLLVGGLALVSAGLVFASKRFRTSIWVSQLMGGTAAITVGSVLLLDGPALLVGVTVQAAALVVFVHFVTDRWATLQAGAMATVAGLLTVNGMLEAIDGGAPLINDLVHLAIVVACGGWAWWEVRSGEADLGPYLAGVTYAGALLWPVSALTDVPQGQALISAAWAAIGFAILIIAFARSSVRLAHVSLATLAVVMIKLLSIDLAAVDTFWRVALFFVLGGVFLFASFRVGTVLRSLDGRPDDADEGAIDKSNAGGGPPDQESGLAFQK